MVPRAASKTSALRPSFWHLGCYGLFPRGRKWGPGLRPRPLGLVLGEAKIWQKPGRDQNSQAQADGPALLTPPLSLREGDPGPSPMQGVPLSVCLPRWGRAKHLLLERGTPRGKRKSRRNKGQPPLRAEPQNAPPTIYPLFQGLPPESPPPQASILPLRMTEFWHCHLHTTPKYAPQKILATFPHPSHSLLWP